MQIHPLIEDSDTLADLCARLAKSPFVAVDTEFMRENTYWPELCLIQIADANEAAAIDPMICQIACPDPVMAPIALNGADVTPEAIASMIVLSSQMPTRRRR